MENETLKEILSRAEDVGRKRGRSKHPDQLAAYAFDLLIVLRSLTKDRKHAFLSFLIGVAAEEAIRLAEGQASSGPTFDQKVQETADSALGDEIIAPSTGSAPSVAAH